MGEMLLIGGVIGLVIWLAGSSGGAAPPKEADKDTTPVKTEPTPVNGVYPDAGMSLTEAQTILIALGYLAAKTASGKTNADGRYGDITKEALKTFQTAYILTVNGFVDKSTARALEVANPVSASKIVPEAVYEKGYKDGYAGADPAAESACSGLGADSDYCNGYYAGRSARESDRRALLQSDATTQGYKDGADDAAKGKPHDPIPPNVYKDGTAMTPKEYSIYAPTYSASYSRGYAEAPAGATTSGLVAGLDHFHASRARAAAVAGRAKTRRMFL